MNIAGFTYQGTHRPTQQDAMLINGHVVTDGSLYLTNQSMVSCFVADGVGGSANGAFAAQFVLNAIQSIAWREWGEAIQQLREVNVRLIRENVTHAGDTATTLAGCVYTGTEWLIFQAGDSEIYLIRNQKLMPLVKRHNESVEAIQKKYPGLPIEKIHEIAANTITSYFGGKSPALQFDLDWKRRLKLSVISGIQAGDTLLVCSDGLFKSISSVQLLKELQKGVSLQRVCDEVRLLSEQNGAIDNVTIVLIGVI